MERVLKPKFLTSLVLLVFLLGCAQSSFATTAIVPPDDDMIIGARVIVKGRILSIESRFDEQQGRIFTYIKLKVQEVLKGQITERKIVIKELGGQVGDRLSVVYGNPEFALGEHVLMYLDTWKDGSLRTYQMFLGKFSIVKDEKTGHEFAVRGTGDEHVVVLPTDNGNGRGAITDRMEVSAYIAMVKSRLAANIEPSRRFEQTYYSNVPTLASPPGYVSDSKEGEIHPEFTLMNPPARWFEPDTGQAVPYTLNPHASTDPDIPPLVVDPTDIAAAANSWSTVQGCGLHISFSGIVTFKNAKDLKDVAQRVPLERMLIETDSPYLAPVPFRGKLNQPAYVRYVGDEIARLRGLSVDEVARATSSNFFDLFGVRRDVQ